MKSVAIAIPLVGLVLGLAGPASATVSKGHILQSKYDVPLVQQQSTCKEGEVWNEETKKCEKKEG